MITRLLSTCNLNRLGVFVALMSMFVAFSVMELGTVSAGPPQISVPNDIETKGCAWGETCDTTTITININDDPGDLPIQNWQIMNDQKLENFVITSQNADNTQFEVSFRAEATERGSGWNGGQFEFQVENNNFMQQNKMVEVTINSAPVATAVNTTGRINQPVVITLTATDADGDKFCCKDSISNLLTWDDQVNNNGDDQQPYIDTLNSPSNGSISEISKVDDYTASVTYTPNNDFSGQDSFAFRVFDGISASDSTVTITMQEGPTYDGNLAMYWNLDDSSGGTVSDASGNNNTGTPGDGGFGQQNCNGNPCWDNDSNKPFSTFNDTSWSNGGSLLLDSDPNDNWGPRSEIQGPQISNLSLDDADFTFALWVRQTQRGGDATLFTQQMMNGNSNLKIYINGMGEACLGTTWDNPAPNSRESCGGNINVNSWHHLAFVMDATNEEYVVYVDGVEVVSESGKETYQPNNAGSLIMGIGKFWDNMCWCMENGNKYKGQLDEVRLYNRMLSANEVGRLADTVTPWEIADMSPPAVPAIPDLTGGTDSGIANDDNITAAGTVTIQGSTEGSATVTIYIGGVLNSTTTAAANGDWTQNLVLGEATHLITVSATDGGGNASSQSSSLSLVIDRTSPATSGTAPDLDSASDSKSTFTGTDSDNITNDRTPTFTGTAPEAGVRVNLYVDGSGTGDNAIAGAGGAWSITVGSNLSEGSLAITAYVEDTAGNIAVSSTNPLTVTIDATGPTEVMSAPDLAAASDTGSSSTDNITSDTTPTIGGTAGNSFTSQALYVMSDQVGGNAGQQVFEVLTDAVDGSWSGDLSALAAAANSGTVHSITAHLVDNAGNVGAASAALSLKVDTSTNTPSTPDLTSGTDSGSSNSDNITNDTTPTFSGTSEATTTVQLISGSTTLGSTTASAAGAWSITSSALTGTNAGTSHSVVVVATDEAGNVSATSTAFTLTVDTGIDTPATPDMAGSTDHGSSSTDNITNDQTPTFTGTAEVSSTLSLKSDGSQTATGSAHAGTGIWSITAGSLSAGAATGTSHSITIVATDPAGNVSSASSALTVTIDITAPNAPASLDLEAASDSGTNTDNITNDTTPDISGSAENSSTVILYDLVSGSAVASIGTATAHSSTGAWTVTPSTALSAPGTTGIAHSLWASATDVAGNTSATSTALSITVDSTAPATPSTPDLDAASDSRINDDNITTDTTPTFSGTAEGASTVKLYFGSTLVSTGTATGSAGGNGTWELTSATTTDGSKAVTVTSTDTAGNVTSSSALTVSVDNAPPTMAAPTAQSGTEGATFAISAAFTDASAHSQSRVATIDWGLGGAAVSGTVGFDSGSGQVGGSYTYNDDGSFNVVVTVTDEEGMQGTVTIPITVNNSAPVLNSMDNATIGTGTTVVASVPFTDLSPIGYDTHTATFDWGDGTSSNAVVRSDTRTIEASHTYSAVGNFTAQLTVTDDDSGTDTTSVTYGVASVPATVNVPSASVWSLLAMATGLLVALLFYRRRTSVEEGRR